MHELYELKEKLLKELKEYGAKEMTTGSLDVVDKLAHTVKNLCKIIEASEMEEYSQRRSYEGGYARNGGYAREGGSNGGASYYYQGKGENSYRGNGGASYRGDSYRGGSYDGRGSREGGSNSAAPGYSRNNNQMAGMIEELRNLTDETPDERTRRELHQFIEKLEQLK